MSTGGGEGHERAGAEREPGGGGRRPTEEELRAAYEEQIRQVRVEHVLLEHVVTVANLGMRRTGLAPGTEDERDAEQVRLAVESIRALMPLLEQAVPDRIAPIREALSQLQLAFVKIGAAAPAGQARQGGEPPSGRREQPEPPRQRRPGPAEASGRLWVPGR